MTARPRHLSPLALRRRRALLEEGLPVPADLRPPAPPKPPKPPREPKPRKPRNREKPFLAIDGEGCGRDRRRRQHYRLLRCSNGAELFNDGRPLTTYQCLDWICDLPDQPIAGFVFGYDLTHILRLIPRTERLRHIFLEDKPYNARYTYWEDFGIEYIPRAFFAVCRIKRGQRLPNGKWQKPEIVKGSRRVILEVSSFFKCSFLAALERYDIGREHWPMLRRNKRRRATLKRITRETREYCRLECVLLAELMERFRDICEGAGVKPDRAWSGVGQFAAYFHKLNGTPRREEIEALTLAALRKSARDAFYGARFEITRTGELAGPIDAYDLNSAFAAEMRDLPCLRHGLWTYRSNADLAKLPPDALYVAETHFQHPEGIPLCGLPVRTKSGGLVWPREGNGTYWSPELRSACALGATIRHPRGGWHYQARCDCRPFDWIDPLYIARKALGPVLGEPLKRALASLYGKLVQKVGGAPWQNFIWGGLTTALIRARINRAIALDPDAIVMIASDAIFSRKPLELYCGQALGEWQQETLEKLFIVMPGLYWAAGQRVKSRGIPRKIFTGHIRARFERAWRRWREATAHWPDLEHPIVNVPIDLFTGLRIALHQGKPERAGRWVQEMRRYSFDWGRKRRKYPWRWEGNAVVTFPRDGGPLTRSIPHGQNDAAELLDSGRYAYDDQPDWADRAPQ